jgi:hypothetical protein
MYFHWAILGETMLRLFVTIGLAVLSVTPAVAGTDWTKYGSFTGVRCEDAKTIADIEEAAKELRFDDTGEYVSAKEGNLKVLKSTTVAATADRLVCNLRVRTYYDGSTQTYRGRYTVRLYPDGRWTTHFQPNG